MLTIKDVIEARKNVYQHLRPTPLYSYPTLNDLIGTNTWIKHENHHPVGAFKVRGGLNLAANLTTKEKKNGLFTASTGNHGQSIAYAARAYGIKAIIAVPEKANPGKVAAMRGMGAEVLHHGVDFDEARSWIKQVSDEQGGKFVSSTDELLIHGVGTYALEILAERYRRVEFWSMGFVFVVGFASFRVFYRVRSSLILGLKENSMVFFKFTPILVSVLLMVIASAYTESNLISARSGLIPNYRPT